MLPRALEIKDDNLVLNLTTAKVTEYKAKASDYLPEGSYAFVAYDTFFLTFEASALGAVPLPCEIRVVNPVELLPSLSGSWPELRTMVLAFNVPKGEFDTMVFGEGAHLTLWREHLLTQGLRELGYTKGLATYLKEVVLGEETFTVFFNQKLLSLPICQFATSKPDLAFFHNQKYAFEGLLLGCVQVEAGCSTQEEENTYTLTGAVGEDELSDQTAENQMVATMVLLATALGFRAVRRRKFFKKAVVFGQLRTVANDTVCVYKLEMDFERGVSSVSKGNRPVETSKFIQSVK